MSDWQTRVEDERTELLHKLTRLRDFMYTDAGNVREFTAEFAALPEDDKDDLLEQQMHMEAYEAVLARRISRFEAKV